MKRALVVVDDSESHRELLAEAGEVASATGTELVLFSWITPDQFDEGTDAIEAVEAAEHTTYSDVDALDGVRSFAADIGEEVLGSDGPDFEVTAVVTEDDDRAEAILEAAKRHGCDHVYIVGRRRSPTGKVLFGDVAQRVILNFDGHVTISMD